MEKQEWAGGGQTDEWREMCLMIESAEVRSLYTAANILKKTPAGPTLQPPGTRVHGS